MYLVEKLANGLSATSPELPSLEDLRQWRDEQQARLHVAAAGGDPNQHHDIPSLRALCRMPKVGAAVRILLNLNPGLIDYAKNPAIQAVVKQWVEALATNLLTLERDLMHLEGTPLHSWRRDHEAALVKLLSTRLDLLAAVFGYRYALPFFRYTFAQWHIQPTIATKH